MKLVLLLAQETMRSSMQFTEVAYSVAYIEAR